MGLRAQRTSWRPALPWLIAGGAVLLVGGASFSAVALTSASGSGRVDGAGESTATSAAPSDVPSVTLARPRPSTATAAHIAVVPPAPAPAPAPEPAPAPVPEPTPAPAPAAPSGAEEEVLALVNEQRAAAGCGAVGADEGLAAVARAHSVDMDVRDYFDHTNPEGQHSWDRAAAAGISYSGGENIARGQQDAASVMESWMNSPGHRANILNCEFTKLGTGVHEAGGGPWWTQLFGY